MTSDGKGLNRASAASYEAITKARARASQVACDRAGTKGYLAWRECWHELLDPLKNALTSVGAEFRVLTSQDFQDKCITELERGGETFLGFAARVQGLLDGIDSEKRPAQVRAMRTYGNTLSAISKGSAKPFQDATQACYSPRTSRASTPSPPRRPALRRVPPAPEPRAALSPADHAAESSHGRVPDTAVISVRGLVKTFGQLPRARRPRPRRVARARSTASSAPTAPASRRRSGPCSACCAPTAGPPPSSAWTRGRDAVAIHRRLAYVPGDVALWPNLSGGETIDMLMRMRGADPAARRARASCSSASSSTRPRRVGPTPRATGRRWRWSPRWRRRRGAADPRRADLGARPADGGGLQRVRRRAHRRRGDGAALQPHPQRGRAAGRPGHDHPRGPGGRDRHRSTTCATCTATTCAPRSPGRCPTWPASPACTTSSSTGSTVTCTVDPDGLPPCSRHSPRPGARR